MKLLLLYLFIACGTMTAYAAPSEYDIKQDDRFHNYITSDAELARKVEGKVSGIESRLSIMIAILGAIGIALLGMLGAMIKKAYINLLIVGLALGIFLSPVSVKEAECQYGCQQYACRNSYDCPYGCYCHGYYFRCLPVRR